MWSSSSGGDRLLNSTERVTPHAFHYSSGHESVFDMTRAEFVATTTGHLYAQEIEVTEFSSWSASPLFAFQYAMEVQEDNAHIAIIDTEELDNTIVHVPSLDAIFIPDGTSIYSQYHEEYLAHGVIEGKAYKAVPLHEMISRGLTKLLPGLNDNGPWEGILGQLPPNVEKVTEKEVRALRKIAQLYGPKFYIPFIIGLICLKKRSPTFWKDDLKPEEVSMILRVLHRDGFPDWSGSRGVICDNIYDPRYEDNWQMVRLMRALHEQCYGRGARGRAALAPLETSTIFELGGQVHGPLSFCALTESLHSRAPAGS